MEDTETRRKRLLYQARHRGTQEGDLVVGGFAKRYISEMDAKALDQFEALIAETDADLLDWISGRMVVPKALEGPVYRLLVDFKKNL